jgi:excisionase family DNA binding protein
MIVLEDRHMRDVPITIQPAPIQARAQVIPAHNKVLLTVEEAADLLSFSRSLLYVLMANHEIASIKVGRIRRIPLTALHEFVGRRLAAIEKAG